jgi:hypothetical protein
MSRQTATSLPLQLRRVSGFLNLTFPSIHSIMIARRQVELLLLMAAAMRTDPSRSCLRS